MTIKDGKYLRFTTSCRQQVIVISSIFATTTTTRGRKGYISPCHVSILHA
eukprot:CAMPEP_0201701878 /NCGR_PEP_ID=MMETSP0578-20130828/34426_1 /ASSEMBLY_ACC=CAM_ASM_000663 /TAXON_ID=267565 /ORGANISM="Skeletonema grethea, Strain CCMP 1804" /LENGTH=49 /DNA_ID= /DNA_START= /DNA_END= /DNA_ORIENTATION=